ncbi:MAG: hypothetical protein CMH56_03395 [Myxococcales bacterium]|nr:hypothetical protein [Myxococcales bacterium]|tara:strand:- start:1339 stop:1995 length:657 start_codon:yes stop_codon:yes gene_type:complete
MNTKTALIFGLTLYLLGGYNQAQAASVDLVPDDYRVFCGYLDALSEPNIQKLKPKQRDVKIAKMAKLKLKDLLSHVERAKKYGETCEEVGKKAKEIIETQAKSALGDQVEYFDLDYSDPSHVVVSARWKAKDKRLVHVEGLVLAHALAKESSIAKTIAIRGVDPKAANSKSDDAVWFEGKGTPDRFKNINVSRLKKLKPHQAKQADRYLRVFDGLVRK